MVPDRPPHTRLFREDGLANASLWCGGAPPIKHVRHGNTGLLCINHPTVVLSGSSISSLSGVDPSQPRAYIIHYSAPRTGKAAKVRQADASLWPAST